MAGRPVVLVHGAWHGAWCWDLVLDALAERHLDAVAVELPGHGADPGPLTDLHGDAARVREVLDGLAEPAVLVGHSYGGVVITEAGAHRNVAHLLYIASFNLEDSESAMSAAMAETQAASIDHTGRPDALSYVRDAGDGSTTIDPDGARVLFYNDCPPEIADWAVARLGRQPIETLSQSPAAVAWRELPSTYATCTLDNIVHPELQRVLARRATQRVEWPTSHSPFLSRPDLVADLIAGLATGASAGGRPAGG